MSPGDIVMLQAQVLRWVADEPFPGLVEVQLRDAEGRAWIFIDKYPMFLARGDLDASSSYPVDLKLAATVVRQSTDRVVVTTAVPWGIEAVDGTDEFSMSIGQVATAE